MNRSLRAALQKLRGAPGGELARSALARAQALALDDFARQTGSVQIQPRGRGIVYTMTDADIVERHWRELAPIDAAALDPSLPRRASNIGSTRASKSAAHEHQVHYLLLRTASDGVMWRNRAGDELDLSSQSRKQGAAAMAIGPTQDSGWHTQSQLWLVENQALFDRLDWLPAGRHSVAYYSGQLRTGLIEWLAASPRAEKLWFFPDYDGVGLQNYARIKHRLRDDVQFWLMPDWPVRLQRFGNSQLWQSTAREFTSAQSPLAELAELQVTELIQEMARLGLALEQEAVWLQA